jgi:riboflavin-specific deaminase-like protein
MTELPDQKLPGRPFVSLNVATSIDGKLAPIDRGKINFGSSEDRAQMEELRADADAVLIGAGTLRAEDPPLVIRDPDVRARRIATKGAPHPLNVVACTRLPDELERMNFFRSAETEKVVFTTQRSSEPARAAASAFGRVEVVPIDSNDRVEMAAVVCRLFELGVRRLLLEGGGELNFSMLEAGLVDEIYVTFCPFVFGGRDAPTSFGGAGFLRAHVRKLALVDSRVSPTGEIFAKYTVLPERPAVEASALFPRGVELK